MKLSLLSPKSVNIYLCAVCVQSLSRVWISATPWTVAHQAPLSVGFSRQEYRSGWPFPTPGVLPDTGIEPTSLVSPAPAGRERSAWKDTLRCCCESWERGVSSQEYCRERQGCSRALRQWQENGGPGSPDEQWISLQCEWNYFLTWSTVDL